MRTPLWTLLVTLVAIGSTPAAPKLEIPALVRPVGGYAIVEPVTEAKAITYLGLSGVYPFPSRLLADKRVFVLPCQGLPGGKYKFVAIGSLNDEHVVVEFDVLVEGGPGPGPPPPVPPPDDPLAKRVKDAFIADAGSAADKTKWAAALSGFYLAMARHVETDQVATVGDLLADYRAAIPAVLPTDAIIGTRRVCGVEVAAIAGEDPDKKIDAPLKSQFVGLFTKLAAVLGTLK